MIEYCITKVTLLQVNGIKPIMVFDGASLPMKKRIESERKKFRSEARQMAEVCLANGEISKANRKFNDAVNIDSKMIHRFIQVLKQMSVQVIVAPYEADAQLAYLY